MNTFDRGNEPPKREESTIIPLHMTVIQNICADSVAPDTRRPSVHAHGLSAVPLDVAPRPFAHCVILSHRIPPNPTLGAFPSSSRSKSAGVSVL